MGKRGPKPKPTALKKFEGNPGNRELKDDDVQPAFLSKVPDPPNILKGLGREVWQDMSASLHQIGLLTVNDIPEFTVYCSAWDELGEAEKEIEENGLICISEKGAKYQNPAVGIRHQAWNTIIKIGKSFGLNPSSRVGLKIEGNKSGDKLDEFLEG